MKRPILNKKISLKDFKQFYWLKEELKSFCENNELNSSGPKNELTKKIEYFLLTGEKTEKEKTFPPSPDKRNYKNLTIKTKIGKNYKSCEKLRAFFTSIIGKKFKFTVVFQKFCKNNPNKTYQDAIDFWHKNKNLKTTKIAPQFEYNQYIRDFMTANKHKKLSEAIACWKYKKSLPGNNKYNNFDLVALKKTKN